MTYDPDTGEYVMPGDFIGEKELRWRPAPAPTDDVAGNDASDGVSQTGNVPAAGNVPDSGTLDAGEDFHFVPTHPLEAMAEDTRRAWQTGAVRDVTTDKGRFDLLPARAMRELAKHFQQGARKYEDRNWEKGIPLSVFLDSGLRHAFKVLEGLNDERHDRAWAWNAMCFLETAERIKAGLLPPELDDIGFLDR